MKTIKVFLGGGVQLLHGDDKFKGYRNDVIDPVIGQLNSIDSAQYFYIAKDYSDLTRNVVKGKQQNVYNKYIIKEANAAIFIINGNIGNLTKHEINCAVASTKTNGHPLVFIYGSHVQNDSEILNYLNQEGIYYQHFFDNRDLSGKIKTDLQYVASQISKKKFRYKLLGILILILLSIFMYLLTDLNFQNSNINEDCTAQLYLMRYNDINSLTGQSIYNNDILANFHYDDSIMTNKSIRIFPIVSSDSIIHTFNPILRLKFHNKNRNTIILNSAELEIDNINASYRPPKRRYVPIVRGSGVVPWLGC